MPDQSLPGFIASFTSLNISRPPEELEDTAVVVDASKLEAE